MGTEYSVGYDPASAASLNNVDGTLYAAGHIVAPLIHVPKANRNAAYKIHGGAKNSSSLAITAALYSMSEQHPALGEYWRYRVYVMNHDTEAKTLRLSKVAASPYDKHSGTGLTWLTQQLSGIDVSDVTVPAGTFANADVDIDDIAPGILGLDPVLATPMARTDSLTAADAGIYPLILSRTLWANGVRPLSAIDSDWRTRTGLLFKSHGSSYDYVTPNAAAAPTDTTAYQSTFVEFSYTKPTLQVLTNGDSTNTGVGTTSGRFAPVDHASLMSRLAGDAKIMVPLKFASSGRKSAGILGTIQSVINSGLRPDVSIIPSWTVNDGSSPAQFQQSRIVAFQAIDLCERNGIVPILLTPTPSNGVSSLASWKSLRSEVLSMSSRMLVCDMAGAVCDVNTAQYLPGMSGDGTHFNDISTPLIGSRLYSVLRNLM